MNVIEGRIVHTRINDGMVKPAIVTRSWGAPGHDVRNGPCAVNLTIFPDGKAPEFATSVPLCANEEEATSTNGTYSCWFTSAQAAMAPPLGSSR